MTGNRDVLADEHRKIQLELRVFDGKLIVGGAGYTKELLASTLSGLYDERCVSFKEFTMIQHEKTNPGNESTQRRESMNNDTNVIIDDFWCAETNEDPIARYDRKRSKSI